jgi:hypothetical protein
MKPKASLFLGASFLALPQISYFGITTAQLVGGFKIARLPKRSARGHPEVFQTLGVRGPFWGETAPLPAAWTASSVIQASAGENLRSHRAPDEPARHPPSSVYDNPCPWTQQIMQPKYQWKALA